MFPLVVQGHFQHGTIQVEDLPELVSGIAAVVEELRPNDLRTSGNRVTFRGGLYRSFRPSVILFDSLLNVGSGEIAVHPGVAGRVSYRFTFMGRWLVSGLTGVAIFAVSASRDLPGAALFLAAWLGVPFVLTVVDAVQLRALAKRSVDSVYVSHLTSASSGRRELG